MKRRLLLTRFRAPTSEASGSALVLVLLVTALLTTIVVSFLSTSRVEQMATRNFSRQNAASGLAELATQQAMANIDLGFNTTGNLTGNLTGNYTAVVTTQPGAIHKYFFQNGTITQNTTVEQFSAGNITINATSTALSSAISNEVAYLNNLQNPSSNSSATTDQWTITGNASEQINVFMQNVTATVNGANQTIGRVAYYVDDEGTKLNLNAATGDRPSLNVGSSRSLSLSSLASAAQATDFTQVVNGNATSNSSATTDIKNWAHFFRPEQISGAVSGFTLGNIPKLSTAPVAGKDYHLKRTPWGTPRLFINDLPIDPAEVDAIYAALSSDELRNIYGTTFAEKYTEEGLKQIAANILQARDPNVLNDWNRSFSYNGSLLGANGTASNATTGLQAIATCADNDNDGDGFCDAAKKVIPKDYMGNVPYPFINEIGFTILYAGGGQYVRLNIRPYVTILNPWRITVPRNVIDEWEIEIKIDSFRFDLTHEDDSGNQYTFTYGPTGHENDDAWGHTQSEQQANCRNRDSSRQPGQLETWYANGNDLIYKFRGESRLGGWNWNISRAPSYTPSRGLQWREEIQFPCPPYANTVWHMASQVIVPDAYKIIDISNIALKVEYIRLISQASPAANPINSSAYEPGSGDWDYTLRDFISGEELGEVECWVQAPHPSNPALMPDGWPTTTLADAGTIGPPSRAATRPPPVTKKRLDGRMRTTPGMALTQRSEMRAWSTATSSESWPNESVGESSTATNNYDNESFPYETRNNDIPGDPGQTRNTLLYFHYDPGWHHLNDNDWPKLEFTNPSDNTGVYTSPADLGKIQTNVQHRKLRMTTQHPNEVAAGYIPDWAMLDVLSLGSDKVSANNTYSASAPINLNSRFHVPGGGPGPVARTTGLGSMLKALDTSTRLGNPFSANVTVNVGDANSSYHDPNGSLSSTLGSNVGNLTWTTGNFSGSSTSLWGNRRAAAGFPVGQIVLPSEVAEIQGVSDYRYFDGYTGARENIKRNEGRLSAFFPGATTQSRFFTIYAYAQSLDKNGNVDAEQVTKTLVEVENHPGSGSNPFNPPKYKVKKLLEETIY